MKTSFAKSTGTLFKSKEKKRMGTLSKMAQGIHPVIHPPQY